MTASQLITSRAKRRTVEVLLWCGAALGVLSIVTALAALIFSIVPLAFASGSMSPEITTGSLGLSRTVAATELQVGDVVSVTGSNGTRVTHRVVATEDQSDFVVLTLKGDANPSPDRERYRVKEADRVFFTAPHVGRVLMSLISPWGMFLGGLGAAGLLFLTFRRPPQAGTGSPTDAAGSEQATPNDAASRAGRRTSRIRSTMIAVGVPALALVSAGSVSLAAFTDDATVETSGFASHRVLQPTAASCALSGSTVTVNTTVGDGIYTYWARGFNAGGVAVSGYKQMTGTGGVGSQRSASFVASAFTPALGTGMTYTIRLYARVGTTSWESKEFASQPIGWAGAGIACGAAIIAPKITFTMPVDGMTIRHWDMQGAVDAVCGGHGSTRAAACGTMSDANGTIIKVEYILQRTSWISGTGCWNGSNRWVNNCAYRTANMTGNRWSVPTVNTSGINSPHGLSGGFQLTIKATDDDGNVTERTIHFTENV